ncbi:RNA recognition RRM, RBD, or RNP domain [Metschnikowia aff. pulcherrima]|uniref:RNA recognition RRM, RBD, or RNP domain n=1 Tax=Metschnikowia aff. pulcherrima TaxID=2163413 RepID=A0A4P6XFY2_9ASCO|nr:RNA recognition RRM, RBD, or RNP domain [Metschnikowia aff. pulcherrima]
MARQDPLNRKKTYNSKSSDRRVASGKRAESFLHSTQKNTGALPLAKDAWDPKHFRLFVGNLGEDATDEILAAAFAKYASVSHVRVPMDNKSQKNKGFGFVAFASAEDYLKAFKDMNGRYVGLRPVQLKRAEGKPKK